MVNPPRAPIALPRAILPVATATLGGAVFAADCLTPPDWVFSGFYVLIVVMAGRFCRGRALWLVAGGCSSLTILAQVLAHHIERRTLQVAYIGAFNTFDSILVIVLATLFIQRGHQASAALQRAQADLARVSRVTTMGELTASIAHEVNQPITAVVTNAGACLRWLAAEEPDLEKARAAATRIVRDGNRAADIITRIRQVFAKGGPQWRPVAVNPLIRETLDLLGSELSRHAVTVKLSLSEDLPTVMADPVQLQQVVVNLIVNGVDATKEVTGPRELTATSRLVPASHIAVSIGDTGVGLPPADRERLFEAFFTTKVEGAGMGLAISRSIIEAHHGRLWAAPNSPSGALLHFELPLATD
jgi:C4-dicarboxylate-specific signal transduction histidine kinase